jgi:tetratricopeptide (TPR) repeat protein
MTLQEGSRALGEEAVVGRRQDRAYFLELLGDSLGGLGRYEAAIEAYRQAAQELKVRGARCSYALCLLKIADNYRSLHEPWHAIGYLEACVPLLRELGLVRHVRRAQHQLTACRAGLALARLLGEGTGRPRQPVGTGGQVSSTVAGYEVDSRYAQYRRTAPLADR